LPDKTIDAFADHGELTKDAIESDIDAAKQVFGQLRDFDIEIEFITKQLEYEGIQKFIESYEELMEGLEEKRKKFTATS
jgi:transaldolase